MEGMGVISKDRSASTQSSTRSPHTGKDPITLGRNLGKGLPREEDHGSDNKMRNALSQLVMKKEPATESGWVGSDTSSLGSAFKNSTVRFRRLR